MSITRKIGLGLAGLVLSVPLALGTAKHTNLFDSYIPVKVQIEEGVKEIKVPEYNRIKLPSTYCSRYTRLAAKDIFGLDYATCDAWNRVYHDNAIELKPSTSLEQLAAEGMLKSGMMIGVYNPNSTHNNDLDEKGKKVTYTHNLLYLGKSPKEELLFADQCGTKVRVLTFSQIKNLGLDPKYIFTPK